MTQYRFDFDTIIDRSNTASEKWDKYRGRDIIPLWVADMDFRSPPAVIQALHERVEHGVFGYTHPPAELVEAVRDALRSDYGWEVPPEWIVWLPGLVCGLNVLCRAVGGAGDEVVTFTPIYPPFMSSPGLSDRSLVKVPLQLRDGRWVPDLEALERAITPRSRLLLLCSPHNPVGRVWSAEELAQFVAVAERHNLVIGSDDIHAGLVLDDEKRHIPIATLSPEAARRTITLLAPSKTYNIPGLGCSFAVIGDPTLRRDFRTAMGRIVPHVNTLGYTAALAAYRDGEEWRQELVAYLRGNRDLVTAEISTMPGLSLTPAEATYLAWIDARATGIPEPARFFEEAGVGLSDGADFGAPGFVRLNFGCSRPLLVEALGRMRKALAEFRRKQA
ncbi:MalY/PatB family protein [Geobacter pickeringii]|uniref:cysteine-S-conjugate beta-lyase n=1 Tax=Geobacter pickeringii TaxID=345632 RepID=A0A0B5BGP8_9BACT|nr:PatB family C-S lyase [Geobacter pickeringii]AJE03226.1 aspartate aminotransferase [Geobacter pickeringii]